jgi:hypothetical protein
VFRFIVQAPDQSIKMVQVEPVFFRVQPGWQISAGWIISVSQNDRRRAAFYGVVAASFLKAGLPLAAGLFDVPNLAWKSSRGSDSVQHVAALVRPPII